MIGQRSIASAVRKETRKEGLRIVIIAYYCKQKKRWRLTVTAIIIMKRMRNYKAHIQEKERVYLCACMRERA